VSARTRRPKAERGKPLDYAARCQRYARQAGWAYDGHRMSISRLTPRQRRRALHKEHRAWPVKDRAEGYIRVAPISECDVCGLPDNYNGDGDGIGSCDCPRCDGGEAAVHSVFCTCPPDDIPGYDDGYYDGEPDGAGLTEARRGD
jgi:hypothetical protein